MPLLDIVNLNGDASCLASSKWLSCLRGGRDSLFMLMLRNYVQFERKVNLGLVGATVKDIAFFNPEAISFINDHPEVFQLLMRPFTHDNPMFRLPEGFKFNLEQGVKCIRKYFKNVSRFYLPPEIMLTSEQIRILKEFGVQAVFVHKGRYENSVTRRLPDKPFVLIGTLNARMLTIPLDSQAEKKYLSVLHGVSAPDDWMQFLNHGGLSQRFIWRDGESCLLLPSAVECEGEIFAAEQSYGVERSFLSDCFFDIDSWEPSSNDDALRYFPLHSVRPWLDEMRLYWFVSRVRDTEKEIETLSEAEKWLWLLTINSDILSAAEKKPPRIQVAPKFFRVDPNHFSWNGVIPVREKGQLILSRSERAGEGQDYLAYFDELRSNRMTAKDILNAWQESKDAHLKKAYARLAGEFDVS